MNLIKAQKALLVFLLFSGSAMAQPADDFVTKYTDIRKESDPIYNGLEYSRYSFYINSGIPYFTSDTMSLGSVVYDGVLYNNIPLMYDMVLDELIANDFSGKNMMRLVKQKVDSFSLYGNTFISIKKGSQKIPEGYYLLMQHGEKQVLKKEIKTLVNKVKFGEDLEKNIESKVTYYVKRDGNYFISTPPFDK